ncbi:family 20 glycosylhydrolase [Rhodocytophaga rosea]|uniref:beta-N-acetylhexosaminidase n=1 Tax=Rhodocytophaga rosea TaxID=2704465 RepID=A0A6C0GK75_9BACT|nr:family 20 glycosylhydrolase [Rhodocytophaga rosea]QHT68347.1 family 20 glycosylhydrolase [Rhodocytophaga rosea]
MRNTIYLFTIALLISVCYKASAQESAASLAIIPQPVSIKTGSGSFELTSATQLIIPSGQAEVQKIAALLTARIQPSTGFNLKTVSSGENNSIQLVLNQSADTQLGKEGYSLEATPTKIVIKANQSAGLFYGVQTLLQLLPKQIEASKPVTGVKWQVPAVTVIDYPRFGWRGIMLDVSRHFFSKEFVKKYIDQLACYKYNRLHFHLTDDNGWRVEIKSLPKLTSVGAWRVDRVGTFNSNEPPKPGEKAAYGGFYTQDDIKEIVQYAKERYVEIMPEVDIPGHSMAAIAAYPELSTTKDANTQVNPGSNFATWHNDGTFTMHIENTLNPSDEKVYQFLDKVFTEIAQLFPFEYIHMGGDECYHGYWKKDPGCQALMKSKNMKNTHELQSYFGKRVNDIIKSKGKKAMGWDEILEGGLPSGAGVMSWHSLKGGVEAAKLKAPAVMTPAQHAYLDYVQGDPSLEPPVYASLRLQKTYNWDPLPAGIDSTSILGGQGNLWTEQIPTTQQVEYMTYPRAFALSEVYWSPKSQKNWNSFVTKVETHFDRFDQAQINYARSMYDPIIAVKKNEKGQMVIQLSTEVPGLDIHYTVDNSQPSQYHPLYKEPIVYPEGADIFRVITYKGGKPVGKMITIKTDDLAKRVRK